MSSAHSMDAVDRHTRFNVCLVIVALILLSWLVELGMGLVHAF